MKAIGYTQYGSPDVLQVREIDKPRKQILGGYFSGKVESMGVNVTTFKTGDQFFGTTQLRFGAHGEYVCLPANYTLVPKPSNMSFAEAAGIPFGGLNALHFLRNGVIGKG